VVRVAPPPLLAELDHSVDDGAFAKGANLLDTHHRTLAEAKIRNPPRQSGDVGSGGDTHVGNILSSYPPCSPRLLDDHLVSSL
jgi:hypothetical protein